MMSAKAREGDTTIRIAMWSGPRNLSTALMRSFGSRQDCAVTDEPFYAAYLRLSGADHPMRETVLRHCETDWRVVSEGLRGPPPGGRRLWYQKHMTHHMLPEIGRDWMEACRHAFLIRHPRRVLASYAAKREAVTLSDIGFLEQAELFDAATGMTGAAAPVIDADALLSNPRSVLVSLCEALDIPFRDSMLSWPPGPRDTDGIWAQHWYEAVHRSSGFGPVQPMPALDDPHLLGLEEKAMPIYRRLAAHALS
jgi:hypothetical protein